MNVDVGGGTAKIAVCVDGQVVDLTALDVGARLVCFDADGRITRLEEAGRRFGAALGLDLALGAVLAPDAAQRAGRAHGRLPVRGDAGRDTRRSTAPSLLRLDPLVLSRRGRRGDLLRRRVGIHLRPRARQLRRSRSAAGGGDPQARRAWGPRIEPPDEGIRATVIGASQYTTQVSGSTIFVAPMDVLPLRNVPVIAPAMPLDGEVIDADEVTQSIQAVLKRMELDDPDTPVAIFVPWHGSATYQRLDAFCRGRRRRRRAEACARPSAGARRRRRCRRPDRHPFPRRDAAGEPDRVGRRA